MKTLFFLCLIVFTSCSPLHIQDKYAIQLPELPPAWEEILGAPNWRLEWLNPDGKWHSQEGRNRFMQIELMQEWTTPVFAWPFWPEKELVPGIMHPAGALFPWDVNGDSIVLTWEAGIDAFFWRELAANFELQNNTGTARYPWYLDWPRFRELMQSENVPPEILDDPWLADWKSIAVRTVESGFDRRRIKAAARKETAVFCPNAVWAGISPFASPITNLLGQALVIPASEVPETWVSVNGLLRCHKNAWVFIPWQQ